MNYGETLSTKVTMFDSGTYEAVIVLIKIAKPLADEKANIDKQRNDIKKSNERLSWKIKKNKSRTR